MKHWIFPVVCIMFFAGLAACGSSPTTGGPANTSPASSSPLPAPSPLPAEAYKATITIANPPQSLHVGEKVALTVKVKNDSTSSWPATGQGSKYKVDLGNHWLDKNGATVVLDDGRASLPHDLKPGDEVELYLTVKVQEDLSWFGPHGSPVAKANIKVQ
jgi:hypothetical protein